MSRHALAPRKRLPLLLRAANAVRSLYGASSSTGAPQFAGAQLSRLTMDWVMRPLSPDRELMGDLTRLRARARQLVRDTPYAAQFLRLLADNVVGHYGIKLQGRVKNAKDEYNRPVNEQLERGWTRWSRPMHATMDGRLSFAGVQRLAIQTVAQDGECFLQKIYRTDTPFGFSLRFLDADLLDETLNRPHGAGGNAIRMGIEVDEWEKPVAYWFYRRHPDELAGGGTPNERRRIPAEQIIHLFVTTRIGQVRGYPWFAPVMIQQKMLDGYQEAEVTAARVGAAKMGFITREGEGFGGGEGDSPDDEPLRMDAEPGTMQELLPGQGFEAWDPQHPNSAYRDFVKGILHGIAAGLGASYASLSADLEGTSFASGRTGLLQERDHWKALQQFLVDHLCWPTFTPWLDQAFLAGGLKLDGRVRPEQYEDIQWQSRGWPWVDPQADVNAAETAIKLGLTSRTRVAGEEGRDVEEVFAELDRENQMAEEYDIEIVESAEHFGKYVAASGMDGKGPKKGAPKPPGKEESPEAARVLDALARAAESLAAAAAKPPAVMVDQEGPAAAASGKRRQRLMYDAGGNLEGIEIVTEQRRVLKLERDGDRPTGLVEVA